jgi:hypothetical protein
MSDVARNTGRNMVAIWGAEERLLMLDVACNRVLHTLATCTQ